MFKKLKEKLEFEFGSPSNRRASVIPHLTPVIVVSPANGCEPERDGHRWEGQRDEDARRPPQRLHRAASVPTIRRGSHLHDDQLTPAMSKDDFHVVKQLGKGSFATVMLVQKIDNGQLYAMKVIDKLKMLNHGRIRDLFSERSVLKRARHPFIVKLHYTFQSKHQLLFVIDYMEGGDLLSLLERSPGRCFSEDQARFYAAEVFMALSYLHENGVVYRDLKPSNILLDSKGHACLADMGLCKEFRMDSTQTDNRCHSFVGSPGYVAPEIIRRQKYGVAVDWWSYGVLLHRMLCGEVPFRGETPKKIFDNILRGSLNLHLYPWLSTNAKALLTGLLQTNESTRFQAAMIRSHPFFHGVSWRQIFNKSISPPNYVRRLSNSSPNVAAPSPSSHDSGHQRRISNDPNNSRWLASPAQSIGSCQQQQFAGFSFCADNFLPASSSNMSSRPMNEPTVPISREQSALCLPSPLSANPDLMFPMDDSYERGWVGGGSAFLLPSGDNGSGGGGYGRPTASPRYQYHHQQPFNAFAPSQHTDPAGRAVPILPLPRAFSGASPPATLAPPPPLLPQTTEPQPFDSSANEEVIHF